MKKWQEFSSVVPFLYFYLLDVYLPICIHICTAGSDNSKHVSVPLVRNKVSRENPIIAGTF